MERLCANHQRVRLVAETVFGKALSKEPQLVHAHDAARCEKIPVRRNILRPRILKQVITCDELGAIFLGGRSKERIPLNREIAEVPAEHGAQNQLHVLVFNFEPTPCQGYGTVSLFRHLEREIVAHLADFLGKVGIVRRVGRAQPFEPGHLRVKKIFPETFQGCGEVGPPGLLRLRRREAVYKPVVQENTLGGLIVSVPTRVKTHGKGEQ